MLNNPYLTISKVKLLSVSFFATIIPHFLRLPIWVSLLVIACVVWRFHLSNTGSAIPNLLTRISLITLAIILIFLQYGALFGRDPGVAFLILMLGFKMLEMKTKRDVLFFLFLNYFVIITNFLYSQNFLLAIYMFIAVWFITSVLININRLNSTSNLKIDFRLSFTIIAQALPIMLVMFLLFPRIDSSIWKLPEDARNSSTGLSDKMSPGDISKLIKNHKIAFRVKFAKQAPEKKNMYWRGPVLSQFDGRSWNSLIPKPINLLTHRLEGKSYSYTITLEATGKKYLPTLDIPGSAPENAYLSQEYSAYSNFKVDSRKSYSLYSRAKNADNSYSSPNRRIYTRSFSRTNPKTHRLIKQLVSNSYSDKELIEKVLLKFRNQNYVYTLNPPILGKHSIDDFLFKTRRGFCEHYASAFVVMMRSAGIASRVVTGYQGGEYNPVGNYYIVRNSDAHAWAEVWLPGQGWLRVDPTAYIAPERIEKGIDASLRNESNWDRSQYSKNAIVRNISLYWDSLNNSWNQWVLGYGEELQAKLLSLLGFDNPNWQQLVILLFALIAMTLLIVFLYYNYRKTRLKKDEAEISYIKFCKKIERAGLTRYNWEGPQAFSKRVANYKDDLAKESLVIFDLYIDIRYGDKVTSALLHQFKVLVKNFQPNKQQN